VLEGIICIDKPVGFTSFDVVAKARGITKSRKVGHGGTLDPLATGVLPLFWGRSAKATALMPSQDKRYTAKIRFGVTTDTQDITGKQLSVSDKPVLLKDLEAALETQKGEIQQLPPMFSAVWVDGQRLYSLARQGREIERPQRNVTVYSLDLLSFDEEKRECVIDVKCSKGTYIRTICHDIGEILGCGGILTELRRTETLGFTIDDCVTLDELSEIMKSGGQQALPLKAVDSVFKDFREIHLSPKQTEMFLNGVRLDTNRIPRAREEGTVRVYGGGIFLGLACIDAREAELRVIKLFATKEE